MLPDPEIARILAERRRIETERRARDTGFIREARHERPRLRRPAPVVPRPVMDPDPCPPPCPHPAEGARGWAGA